MRRCAHRVVRHQAMDRGRTSQLRVGSDRADATDATALVGRISDMIPVPPAALTRDDRAWCAFEGLLDQAAIGLAEAVGPEGRPALEAVFGSPLDAGPVSLLLVERTLRQLAKTAH